MTTGRAGPVDSGPGTAGGDVGSGVAEGEAGGGTGHEGGGTGRGTATWAACGGTSPRSPATVHEAQPQDAAASRVAAQVPSFFVVAGIQRSSSSFRPRARDTQIIIVSFAACSSLVSTESR